MLTILHGLVWLLVAAALLGLIAAMVSLLRLMLSYDRSTRTFTARRLPVRTLVACGTAWLLMFVTIQAFEALLRARVREVLTTASSPVAVVAESQIDTMGQPRLVVLPSAQSRRDAQSRCAGKR